MASARRPRPVRETVSLPTNFVGTVYDHNTKVYLASRKDGSLTMGRFNERGTNIKVERPEGPRP